MRLFYLRIEMKTVKKILKKNCESHKGPTYSATWQRLSYCPIQVSQLKYM